MTDFVDSESLIVFQSTSVINGAFLQEKPNRSGALGKIIALDLLLGRRSLEHCEPLKGALLDLW